MSENAWLDEQAVPIVWRAITLLDACFDVLVKPERWCQGAWAKDAEGKPIAGTIVEAVESSQVASRCTSGELLHQGLARGYRIEIRSPRARGDQIASEVTRAPASWMVAALALMLVARSFDAQRALRADELRAKCPSPRPMPPGQVVLQLTVWNDTASYEDAITCVVLAAQMLRAELDRRAWEAS